MTKIIALVATVVSAVAAAPALAHHAVLAVEDPTPNRFFSGTYVVAKDDPATEEDEYQEGTQDGHIAVYEDGVVACNGNGSYETWDQNGDGTNDPIQGYVWIGPGQAASGDYLFVAPENAAGAGSNHGKWSGKPTGESPCPESDPEGDGAGQ